MPTATRRTGELGRESLKDPWLADLKLVPHSQEWIHFPLLHVGSDEKNMKKFEVNWPWESKLNVAFWRGSATGGGVTRETNQRLQLACLDHEWNLSKDKKGYDQILDAKLITWNKRDKKIAGTPMTYIKQSDFQFKVNRQANFVNLYEQTKWKF